MSPTSSPSNGNNSPKNKIDWMNGGGNKLTSTYFMYLLVAFVMSIIGIQRSTVWNFVQEYSLETSVQQQHKQQAWDVQHTGDDQNNNNNAQQRKDTEVVNTEKKDQKLNIVLFYADDWTYYTLGAMGNKFVHTPNLDKLAQDDGILFTRNCVVTSVCMQSRATLYTGQYSSVHKSYYAWYDITMYQDGKWNETLYPTMVRNQYHTGFFGKYHHIEDFSQLPPTFTEYHSIPMEHETNCYGQRKHVTQCNEDDGIKFLKERPMDDTPFFLTMSFFATHAQDDNPIHYIAQNYTQDLYSDNDHIPNPKTHTEEHYQSLPPFLRAANLGRIRYEGRYDTPERYQHNMKIMYRMASEVDATCGRIIQLLKDQNVYDNTLIIFTTDNGNFHGEHGLSEKWYAYEESIRVPLIIKDPRMNPVLKGTINDEFTLNIDLAPTILSAANVPIPKVMQGQDMAKMYVGKSIQQTQSYRKLWRKEFLYEFFWNNNAIPNSLAMVGRDYKYIYWYNNNNYTQYFNLTEDPYEENDIYNTLHVNYQMELYNKLHQYKSSVESGVVQ